MPQQVGVEQGGRRVLHAGQPQPEYGRRLDDGWLPHFRVLPS
ncbi:hypothetical protein [Streptomyces sp. ISL-99]|nr:hypothetical protein [Streptomyces sp. ISL-99]